MDVLSTTIRRLTLAAVMMAAACAWSARGPSVPLTDTFETPEALAAAVLARLARNDVAGLRAMALSEEEFRAHVWPELPASRPERNIPFAYAWGQLQQRSDGHLTGTVARYAGKPLTLIRTRYTGAITRYATFEVMRDSEIVAADETGRDLVLRLFGSVLVKNGRYKLFSYVVDE